MLPRPLRRSWMRWERSHEFVAVVGVCLLSVTGEPVGVGQWFDGYAYNAASTRVSVSGPDSAAVTLEVLRLDGTLVDDSGPVSVSGSDGWVTIGDVFWTLETEDVLIYRITTTGAGDVQVDWTLVGLTT